MCRGLFADSLTMTEPIQKDTEEDTQKDSERSNAPVSLGSSNPECREHLSQIEEYKAGWQRAQADYRNLQSEIEKNKAEMARWSERAILEEFIPVYDNFKKAFRSKDKKLEQVADENWAKGIEYIMKQFGDILKQHGVEEIPTLGHAFDPELHEAVGEAPSDEQDDGNIIQEIEGGYSIKGRVLRVAKVLVCKKI